MGIPLNSSFEYEYDGWDGEPGCDISGDHSWKGGTCSDCGKFSGALLNWARVEKAEAEGRHHGNHYHISPIKANLCKKKTHDPVKCENSGGCLYHEASEEWLEQQNIGLYI